MKLNDIELKEIKDFIEKFSHLDDDAEVSISLGLLRNLINKE